VVTASHLKLYHDKEESLTMKTALAIAAHPDDIEFLMAGTLLHLRDAGYELHYLTVANGCCGSTTLNAETIAQIRRQEAMAAAAALGAVFHDSLCNDLEIFYEKPLLTKLAAVVRQVAPDILLTHSPTDYMEDHTNACRLAVTAAFARGMPNFPTDPPCPPVEKNVSVYHAQPYGHQDPLCRPVTPDLFVDTTGVIERKAELLALHASQRNWLRESQGIDSYLITLRELDAQVGRMSGRFQFAEGWRWHLHMGFCGPDDNPLCAALGEKVQRAR
jgi:LmbE family N-acetylglucosaminyl deacetylase